MTDFVGAYNRARTTYLNCIRDPDADCDDERDAMDEARRLRDEAYDTAERESDECKEAGEEAERARDELTANCS